MPETIYRACTGLKKILWTHETKINLYQKTSETAHDPKYITSSVKHGRNSITAWAYMATSGTVSLLFFDDVITDRRSKISAQTQPNIGKLIR